jgi:hypothetical protein
MYGPALQEEKPQGLTNLDYQGRPPQREGFFIFHFNFDVQALFPGSQGQIDENLHELKRAYVFPADSSVENFLADHPALPSVLLAAEPHLKESFGPDSIFNLEVSTDDDDSKMLYSVVIWNKTVQAAVDALERFEERWWLDHMTPDLAFTYELA